MKSLTGRSEHNAPWSTLSAPTTDPPHNPTRIVRPINIVLYRESWDEPALWLDRSLHPPLFLLQPPMHSQPLLFPHCLLPTEFLRRTPPDFPSRSNHHPPLLPFRFLPRSFQDFLFLQPIGATFRFTLFDAFSQLLLFTFFLLLSFTSFLGPFSPIIPLSFPPAHPSSHWSTNLLTPRKFQNFIYSFFFFFYLPLWSIPLLSTQASIQLIFSSSPSFFFTPSFRELGDFRIRPSIVNGDRRYPRFRRYPGRECHKNRRFRSILAAGGGRRGRGAADGGRAENIVSDRATGFRSERLVALLREKIYSTNLSFAGRGKDTKGKENARSTRERWRCYVFSSSLSLFLRRRGRDWYLNTGDKRQQHGRKNGAQCASVRRSLFTEQNRWFRIIYSPSL